MKESIKIIQDSIHFISLFNSKNCVSKTPLSNKSVFLSFQKSRNRFKSSMEDLIFSFHENSLGLKVTKGSSSAFLEAPKGETGVHLFSDGSNKPYRCKIKAPGFLHLQGLDLISKNLLIADVVTNIGSLDIVFGEIDR